MNNLKGRFHYAKHASNLHKRVGELIYKLFPAEIIIQNASYKCLVERSIRDEFLTDPLDQEEMLKDAKRLELDFMIPQKKIAIEVQGRQHYMPIAFSSDQEAEEEFKQIQFRDQKKRNICKTCDWHLVEVPYDHEMTIEALSLLIFGKGVENVK